MVQKMHHMITAVHGHVLFFQNAPHLGVEHPRNAVDGIVGCHYCFRPAFFYDSAERLQVQLIPVPGIYGGVLPPPARLRIVPVEMLQGSRHPQIPAILPLHALHIGGCHLPGE